LKIKKALNKNSLTLLRNFFTSTTHLIAFKVVGQGHFGFGDPGHLRLNLSKSACCNKNFHKIFLMYKMNKCLLANMKYQFLGSVLDEKIFIFQITDFKFSSLILIFQIFVFLHNLNI